MQIGLVILFIHGFFFYARFYNHNDIVSKKYIAPHLSEVLSRHIEHINVSGCEICLQLSKENCGDIVPAQRVQAHDKNLFFFCLY